MAVTTRFLLTGKETVTLQNLYAQACKIKQQSSEVILNSLSDASVTGGRGFGNLRFLAPLSSENGTSMSMMVNAPMSEWAFYQLCSSRLGVPYQYMKKCLDSPKPSIQSLFETNLNTWLDAQTKGARIRLYKPDNEAMYVRGIVSDSYTVFDSDRVLGTMLQTMEQPQFKGQEFVVKGHQLDEIGMQLRLVQPHQLDIEGEDLFAGFIITSGDVGNRNLTVRFFIWKQICTNGLVMSKAVGNMLQKRHRGSCEGEFASSLASALEQLPDFCKNAKAIIEESRGKPLSVAALQKKISSFANAYKLDEKECKRVAHLTKKVYSMTEWGFINALTEFAQEPRFDLDTRTEIEAYAGKLLSGSRAA